MKNRNLYTNIFSIIIMVALILFMLAQFGVFPVPADLPEGQTTYVDVIKNICLPIALASVAIMEIVLPVLDNRKRLNESYFLTRLVLKIVLFAIVVVVLILQITKVIQKESIAMVLFIVFYLLQFFINLDSSPSRAAKRAVPNAEAAARDRRAIREDDTVVRRSPQRSGQTAARNWEEEDEDDLDFLLNEKEKDANITEFDDDDDFYK